MSDLRDFTGKNRKFTGTDSIKLPSGTTARNVSCESTGRAKYVFDFDNRAAGPM